MDGRGVKIHRSMWQTLKGVAHKKLVPHLQYCVCIVGWGAYNRLSATVVIAVMNKYMNPFYTCHDIKKKSLKERH